MVGVAASRSELVMLGGTARRRSGLRPLELEVSDTAGGPSAETGVSPAEDEVIDVKAFVESSC